ncbi:hypothetical protein FKG94_01290 [Exilibacterium tricleocarpae]|uniref:Nucleoside 2-deoxyribosyltransferase n=1 Tax=Exilibacterium tricleocarpae TaxID=2591008 RepID=A0A545UA24_9GAMM|nr:nucleoside 2-deoxyribosyltransferase [Exilibacterium tricleocarpae]TQV86327.1 hypothetical protein FKG94_01290 [Exilibacterium tricleocarpae]
MGINYAQWRSVWAVVFITLAPAFGSAQAANQPVYYVYLAGPEVFLPQPVAAGEDKKAVIAALNRRHNWPFQLVGLYPMDNEIPDFKHDRATGLKIYRANIALMDKAHFIAANMVRFRGPSMDVGTAFEMGYMRGQGKPVFAYYESKPFYGRSEKPGIYADRVKQFYRVDKARSGWDIHGQSIEDFGMADNLMMIGALDDAGADIQLTFVAAIERIAAHIQARTKKAPTHQMTMPAH